MKLRLVAITSREFPDLDCVKYAKHSAHYSNYSHEISELERRC